MVFPETVLFDFILLQLEEEMAGYVAPTPYPMRCDRWVARSGLQKGIRRGEVEIAQCALANLLEQDRYGVWRHLTVIALEDVGVAGMDTVAQVVAASRNRPWRNRMGGEWVVASFLVRHMAESVHCQAACDLLLRATNRPSLEARTDALDAEPSDLLSQLSGLGASLESRALAALALGGGLADEQRHRDPASVFDLLAGQGYSSHVVATCHAAWRASRNPMALLLPLVWQQWMTTGSHAVQDDDIPSATMLNGVPDYAIDQFTRVGGEVARAYLSRDGEMRAVLDAASIPRGQQPRALGDLLFLVEGSPVIRRAIWQVGERLRRPHRALPVVAKLRRKIRYAQSILVAKAPLIASLRAQQFHQQSR